MNAYESELSRVHQEPPDLNGYTNTKPTDKVRQRTSIDFSSVVMHMNRSPSPALRRLGDTTFHYTTLNSHKHEFRLLKILPETTSHIKCELIVASLRQPPSYVSLSYAWGDKEDTRTILLHGHEFPITLSLWYALARLRSRTCPVLIWVDAVCINQKDINERSHQVQSMINIYALATSVNMWLGPESEDSNLAIQLLDDIVTCSDKNNGDIRGIIFSPSRIQDFRSLAGLFERDYWYRLWVIQEIHNARAVDVYCGPSKLPWETYKKASVCLIKYQADLVRAFPRIDNRGRECTTPSYKGNSVPEALQLGPGTSGKQEYGFVEGTRLSWRKGMLRS